VPVGEDQVQHVEMTQDMAERFNHTYQTQILKRPEVELSNNPKITGTDGQKMSKSYGNAIELFTPLEKTRKIIMSIKTDSRGVDEAKDPKSCNVLSLLRLMASSKEMEEWEKRYRRGGVGYGEVKQRLFEVFEETFEKARSRYEELRKRPDDVENLLREGASRVHAFVKPLMHEVRKACGLRAW
jgi:tryptophanyl-tRNA synthetase